MNTNQYLDAIPCNMPYKPREKVICADGFSISIQASEFHYCIPRTNFGPYEAVELGFPTREEPLIAEYAEDKTNLTGTVYGYVPVEIVDQMIEDHGGIVYPVVTPDAPVELGDTLELRVLESFDEK